MDTTKFNSLRYSHSFTSELNPMTKIRIQKMVDMLDPCDKVLDIGCWDGYIMEKILSLKKAKKTIGVDNSKPAIKLCAGKGLTAKWVKSVDERLPFKKNEFDAVVAGEIIEHLYDVGTFLSEINRILKKGGQLILTTPNLTSLGSRLSLLLGKTPWMIENEITPPNSGHIRYFTYQTLEELLKKHGFIIDSKNADVINVGDRFYLNNDFVIKRSLTLGRIIIIHAAKI